MTPVSSSTRARRLKCFMAEAGIDISIFTIHSVRGASCSTATGVGLQPKIYYMLQTGPQRAPPKDFTAESLRKMTRPPLVLQSCHQSHLQTIHIDMKLSLLK